MNHSGAISWGAAIVLSLLLHSMMFMQSGGKTGLENIDIVKAPLITRLNFIQPKVELILEQPASVEKPSQKKVESRPVKEIEPVKKQPVQNEKLRSPEPVKMPEPVKSQEPVIAPVPQQAVVVPQEQQFDSEAEALLRNKREQYLVQLLSHIESFKYYPRAARRRAIEGEIEIKFNLQNNGSYQQLLVRGQHKVLIQAASQALEASLPLPVPPIDIELSRQIAFTMVYSLKD